MHTTCFSCGLCIGGSWIPRDQIPQIRKVYPVWWGTGFLYGTFSPKRFLYWNGSYEWMKTTVLGRTQNSPNMSPLLLQMVCSRPMLYPYWPLGVALHLLVITIIYICLISAYHTVSKLQWEVQCCWYVPRNEISVSETGLSCRHCARSPAGSQRSASTSAQRTTAPLPLHWQLWWVMKTRQRVPRRNRQNMLNWNVTQWLMGF